MYSGLMEYLYELDIIDATDMEELAASSSSTRRAEKLMSLMSRKKSAQFEIFLNALDTTGQKHVADVIRGKQQPRESKDVDDDLCQEIDTICLETSAPSTNTSREEPSGKA